MAPNTALGIKAIMVPEAVPANTLLKIFLGLIEHPVYQWAFSTLLLIIFVFRTSLRMIELSVR